MVLENRAHRLDRILSGPPNVTAAGEDGGKRAKLSFCTQKP